MGNLLTHPEEIRHLRSQVEELDKNKDGLISKEEFKEWSQQQSMNQQSNLESFRNKLQLEYESKYAAQLSELEKENESLKAINANLEMKLNQMHDVPLNNDNENGNGRPLGEISKEKLNKTVERLIKSETNIKWLPDFVERQIYRNIFNILLGALDELVSSTSLEILGHTLTMNLEAMRERTSDGMIDDNDIPINSKKERRLTID